MRFKLLILTLILSFVSLAEARECGLEVALKDPNIANNPQFWEDYAKLTSTEDSRALGELLKKYGHQETGSANPVQTAATKTPQKSLSLEIKKQAEKEIAHLPKELKEKVDKFVAAMTKPGGLLEVRNNPGSYRLEKLSQFGENAHSIRLNEGYRVLFDLTDKDFTIRMVNKDKIHGN